MRLQSATADATFSLSRGGRLASLVVAGHDLVVTASEDSLFGWGSFPMVPYAGRVRHGRFEFDGHRHQLPISMPPHAIHGTAWQQRWRRTDDGNDPRSATIECGLGDDWPFGGRVEQQVALSDDRMDLRLRLTAGERPMPAMLGWHPWFRRDLRSGSVAELQLSFESMYELDDEGIPTGHLVDVGPGPWDDCFTGAQADPTIVWPGALELSLSSSCTDWVVYDRPVSAFCIEPQTGAPDEFNRNPTVLEPGGSIEATFSMAWTILDQ